MKMDPLLVNLLLKSICPDREYIPVFEVLLKRDNSIKVKIIFRIAGKSLKYDHLFL